MQELLCQIQNYMDYLSQLDLHVSIHFKRAVFLNLPADAISQLASVNTHTNPYCISVKSQMLEKMPALSETGD